MVYKADNILGAFSEEQVAKLTGLSRAQLRRWNKIEFIRPEFQAGENSRKAFTYIYSFKDLLKLRVLNQLRNVYSVSMPELRRVAEALDHLGEQKWTSQRLWVHNRKVVFEEPESSKKREVSSKQFVADIPLEVVISDVREDISKMNMRGPDEIGKIEKRRHVHSSELVFVGTRITVSSIIDYIEADYADEAIIREFPSLAIGDIEAARRYLAAEVA